MHFSHYDSVILETILTWFLDAKDISDFFDVFSWINWLIFLCTALVSLLCSRSWTSSIWISIKACSWVAALWSSLRLTISIIIRLLSSRVANIIHLILISKIRISSSQFLRIPVSRLPSFFLGRNHFIWIPVRSYLNRRILSVDEPAVFLLVIQQHAVSHEQINAVMVSEGQENSDCFWIPVLNYVLIKFHITILA